MPNVMGRKFPYTPEGMAAAEQYKQSMGMRDGGSMGFRPLGYADGGLGLTEMGRRAAQQSVSSVMGAPVDAVNVGLGAVGLGSTTPVGGSESISNAIDTVSALVQQFTAQGTPEPVKSAVNAAIGTFGMPVDLVNSALSAIGVPVSDNPIGGSQNLTETFGMRDGGSMGFRPLGYQEGGSVSGTIGPALQRTPANVLGAPADMDERSRTALIEYLMVKTGMGPGTFVDLTNAQLRAAREKVDADALAVQMQQDAARESNAQGFVTDMPGNQQGGAGAPFVQGFSNGGGIGSLFATPPSIPTFSDISFMPASARAAANPNIPTSSRAGALASTALSMLVPGALPFGLMGSLASSAARGNISDNPAELGYGPNQDVAFLGDGTYQFDNINMPGRFSFTDFPGDSTEVQEALVTGPLDTGFVGAGNLGGAEDVGESGEDLGGWGGTGAGAWL
jgi:hypothetical protein